MVLTGATRNATVRPLIHAILDEIGETDLAPILKVHPELGRELNRAPAENRHRNTMSVTTATSVGNEPAPDRGLFQRVGRLFRR